MRKLIFAINLTLDGCCDHTKFNGGDDIQNYFTELMQDFDLLVYGRKTFALMVPFWPDIAKKGSAPTKAMIDFAQQFDSKAKLVFSRSLKNTGDSNSRIAHGDLKETILALKQQEGKHIMTGGVDLPTQMTELGLIDEFIFVYQPILAGEGRRFLDTTKWQQGLQLELIDQKVLNDGSIASKFRAAALQK
ncbi:dihydrofolate reductase [Pseudoflavitalea sp. G-6-1-2]|uniref:dihydrofolate reductase family protein n=1 Tax=Pseudoflavitalea sp. G-6-1-2 TaxID=2728841 RepID=UPI00146D297A|nr:dihydrofolate reductase family protein [Pseudoflavitalea sp. G-6-1-2]NML22399.1 dihydrofolate reductase [Pseudoflavitalea sp. G-6-1-2]